MCNSDNKIKKRILTDIFIRFKEEYIGWEWKGDEWHPRIDNTIFVTIHSERFFIIKENEYGRFYMGLMSNWHLVSFRSLYKMTKKEVVWHLFIDLEPIKKMVERKVGVKIHYIET